MRAAHSKVTVMTALIFMVGVACRDQSSMTTVSSGSEIEIAPGKWLAISRESTVHAMDLEEPRPDPHRLGFWGVVKQMFSEPPRPPKGGGTGEESYISFDWAGKKVEWRGKAIPITLREWNEQLFLIAFDREELISDMRLYLRFFRLNPQGTGFDRIEPRDFPRKIATQNMWLSGLSRSVGTRDGLLDEWQLLRELDYKNTHFAWMLTARIWYQIESNAESYTYSPDVPYEFAIEYGEKYKPIRLPTLVKED